MALNQWMNSKTLGGHEEDASGHIWDRNTAVMPAPDTTRIHGATAVGKISSTKFFNRLKLYKLNISGVSLIRCIFIYIYLLILAFFSYS